MEKYIFFDSHATYVVKSLAIILNELLLAKVKLHCKNITTGKIYDFLPNSPTTSLAVHIFPIFISIFS